MKKIVRIIVKVHNGGPLYDDTSELYLERTLDGYIDYEPEHSPLLQAVAIEALIAAEKKLAELERLGAHP